MEFIVTDKYGREEGYLRHKGVDMDIGADNDFEVEIGIDFYDEKIHGEGCRFFCLGTEYGGVIKKLNPVTKEGVVKLGGSTWRGILNHIAMEPRKEQNYRVLDGEANKVIGSLLKEYGLSDLFTASSKNSGFSFSNYQCKLHMLLADGLSEALNVLGARLKLSYIGGEANDAGYVLVEAAPIIDYSDSIEFSQDSNTNVDAVDYRNGVNHLICLGKGELKNRVRVDLYAWPDGSIRKQQYYKGVDLHEAYYDYGSAEDAAVLEEYGRKRLLENMNYKQVKISVENSEYLELGDIVCGRDWVTGLTVKEPVIQKILQVEADGSAKVTPKLKGES